MRTLLHTIATAAAEYISRLSGQQILYESPPNPGHTHVLTDKEILDILGIKDEPVFYAKSRPSSRFFKGI